PSVGGGFDPPKQATRWMAPAAPVFAGAPAKQATRWMAPAVPVFAGAPAPTGIAWLPFRA
ncbi:hypothetical protein PPS11_21754, partial [Pseudomonas putida S11]